MAGASSPLTFPPAVPRGPDKTPLSFQHSIPRTAGLVSSQAAGPDSRHAQGSKGSNSVPCNLPISFVVSGFFSFLSSVVDTVHEPNPSSMGLNHLYVKCASGVSTPKVLPSRTPARALTHTRQGCQFISRAPPAEPPDRSICFNRTPLCQSLL